MSGRDVPSCAAETACFKAFSASVVGFCENACAALLALAALDTTPPTMTGKAELCRALELAIDGLRVTGGADVTVGGVDADDPPADAGPELDLIIVILLDTESGIFAVDEGVMTLEEAKLEEDATLLVVICIFEVLDATVSLDVAVTVQKSCGTTL